MNDMEENGATGSEGKATASMACGIGSMVIMCVPFLGVLSPVLAIVGIVLGFMSMKSAKKGFAITGIITSGISLLLAALALAGLAFLGTAMEEQGVTFEEIMKEAQQQAEEAEGR